jgi:drug/metabolite transporter superfamily protein YnfA
MILPFVLFLLFALLSVVGAFLAVGHLRGQKAGLWAAAATTLFFAALLAGLLILLRSGGHA